ncbi:hypothetical protein ACVWZD_000350 [Streptomyces sp. TE3672]
MTFEAVTLDMATLGFPMVAEIAALRGAPLRSWVDTGTEAFAGIVGKPSEHVRARLAKTAGVKDLQAADDEDLRECLRVLRTWLSDPASYIPPVSKPKVQRPEGIGQLPVPRTVKQAHTETTCGLCADPVKVGDLVGRMRDPKDRQFAPMGWLCAQKGVDTLLAPAKLVSVCATGWRLRPVVASASR